jgi:hypothetical protein
MRRSCATLKGPTGLSGYRVTTNVTYSGIAGWRRARQEHAAAVGDLARELEDLGLRQLPRLGVEVLHHRQPAGDRRELELAEERHQDFSPCQRGHDFAAEEPKARQHVGLRDRLRGVDQEVDAIDPHASQRLSAARDALGPPRTEPLARLLRASGPVAWRRSCGRRPSDGYDLDG